ncbi:MAG: hypothetical protein HGA51_11300 [Demequinaceae bacterium]|nr:hypothetical protein [Demequinaceae bacterium]
MSSGKTGLAVAVTALALCACGPSGGSGEENSVVPSVSSSSPSSPSSASASSASPSAAMSPSDLPTIARPTAPPSSPTDVLPAGVLAGRVTALTDACTEVTTDDGVVWSLSGNRQVALKVDDTVIARITDADASEGACGPGKPALLVSIRVVGSE